MLVKRRRLKLLKEYGSIENIYKSLDKITAKKLNENLTANEEHAYMSRDLATIVIDAPITITIDDLTIPWTRYGQLNEDLSRIEI